MFVLTGEGEKWRNRGHWTMHKVLGEFESKEEAIGFVMADEPSDEEVYVITNLDDLTAERVKTW